MIEVINMVFIICTFIISVITLTLVAADKTSADKMSYAKMRNNEYVEEGEISPNTSIVTEELSDIEHEQTIDKDI